MNKISMIVNSKKFSGLENVAISIMEKLKDDFEFVYVTQDGPIVDVLKEKKLRYYIINKMSVKEINKMIEIEKPDIIHAHDFRASFLSSLSRKNIPFLSHLHNNPLWLKRLSLNSVAFLYSSLRADRIITVSDSVRDEFVLKKIVGSKFENISNPVDVTAIINKSETINKNSKKYDLITVARLTEQKDPFRFIDIVKKIVTDNPQIKVGWIGNGELEKKFIEKIKIEKLENNIEYLGFKRNPYVYMKNSSIFILTSKWEGYGLVAFEAMSLGLPCVVSNVGGLPGIVDNSCGKLCVTNDDFIEEINKLLQDNNYYIRKSNLSKKKATKLDNHNIYYKKIKNIYEEMLEN